MFFYTLVAKVFKNQFNQQMDFPAQLDPVMAESGRPTGSKEPCEEKSLLCGNCVTLVL